MPSRAYSETLGQLLADATALSDAYDVLRSSRRAPAGGSDAIPRAMVVLCVSAWEAFVEELVLEAVAALRPLSAPLGVWPALIAGVRSHVGRFNTPNADKVRGLISDSLGLPDVPNSWVWAEFTAQRTRERLHQVMNYRHEIAHGVNPRPEVPIRYARSLLVFFRQLAERTDAAVRAHLVEALGVPNPWPE